MSAQTGNPTKVIGLTRFSRLGAPAFALSLILMCISGCATTTIHIQTKKTPDIRLTDIRTLKLDPFDISGRVRLDRGSNRGGEGAWVSAADLGVDAKTGKTAEQKHRALQQGEWGALRQAVKRDGTYALRDTPDADAHVSGSIYYEVCDFGERTRPSDAETTPTAHYALTRKATVRVKFSFIGKSGNLLGMSEVSGFVEKTVRTEDRYAACQTIPNWDALLKEALLQTPDRFLRKITPYLDERTWTLAQGSACISEGNRAAQNNDWRTAETCWKQGEGSGQLEDRIAATYNLGVYHEVAGRWGEALPRYEKAKKISGRETYDPDIARVLSRMEEARKH